VDRRALTTGEVAEYCGVNFRTVIRWIERGELAGYRLPGRGDHRIPVPDFLAFLRQHRIPVPAELRSDGDTVLIVEDDEPMARAIERVLRGAKYTTHVANDGFRAGALVALLRPAVVTLDLELPGLRGLDVLSFIRGTPDLERVRVLVVSAMPDENLRDALRAGADDILPKPFDSDALLAKVGRLAGRPPT